MHRVPQPRMSRDDLFSMGRHAILQNVSQFDAAMTPAELEARLTEQIWERVRPYVIDTVYISSAADTDDAVCKWLGRGEGAAGRMALELCLV